MFGGVAKRTMSFRIDDLLLPSNTNKHETEKVNNQINDKFKINDNNNSRIMTVDQFDNRGTFVNSVSDLTNKTNLNNNYNQTINNIELLRVRLTRDDKFESSNQISKINNNYNANINNNQIPEDLSTKRFRNDEKNILGHNDSSSAFKGIELKSNCLNVTKDTTAEDTTFKHHTLQCSSQIDRLRPVHGNGSSHWYSTPHHYNHSTLPHHNYPPYFSSSYFHPYSLPLSLSFPMPYTKRKGGQVRFTPQQTQNLERRFGSHQYLSPEDRKILATQLKLTDRQVKTWFQNRRAKWRRTKNMSSSSDCQECDPHTDDDRSTVSNDSHDAYPTSTHSPMLPHSVSV